MNNYIFQKQLQNTLIGQMYFLKYCNFQKLKSAINVNRYLETFRLDRDRCGKFRCVIYKNSFKDERVWSYDASLSIYNFNDIRKAASLQDDMPILTEELNIKKDSLRIRDLPRVNHKLFLRLTPIEIELIPKELYEKMMKITDRDILNFSTK